MTIEEKRKKIGAHCDTFPGCHKDGVICPIFKYDEPCFTDDVELINRNYKEIFGEEDATQTPTTEPDNVNHPAHYTNGGMECIDEMIMIFGKEAVMHFCLCNAWKYRKRALYKNGQEDMDKSDWYLNKYKELGENE